MTTTLEWNNNSVNMPHQFTSTPQDSLMMAKLRRTGTGDDYVNQWDILPPNGGVGIAPTPPIEFIASKGRYAYIAPNLWTIDNVMIADRTIRQLHDQGWGPALAAPPLPIVDNFPVIPTTSPPDLPPITPGIVTISTVSGSTATVATLEELGAAINAGASVLRNDGSAAVIQPFMGGVLVDGNPLQVLLGEPWLPGQWEAVQEGLRTGELAIAPTLPPSAFPWGIAAAVAGVFLLFMSRRKGA
jgi:hypothetical protein